jgi:hypothetical protein
LRPSIWWTPGVAPDGVLNTTVTWQLPAGKLLPATATASKVNVTPPRQTPRTGVPTNVTVTESPA